MANEQQSGASRQPPTDAEKRWNANEGDWKNGTLPARERVAAWLENRGTPLEFQTAVAFNNAGFVVEQGLHEKQPDGKPLEVDVLAVKRQHVADRQAVLGHEIVIECKYAPYPWVAFSPLSRETSDRASYAGARPLETTTLDVARYLHQIYGQKMRGRSHDSLPAVWPAARLAFGLTNLRPQDKGQAQDRDQDRSDKGFDALVGVVARARLRRDGCNATNWHTTQMPMIVIGGELCMAEWNEKDAQMAVKEIDSCIVEFRGDRVLPAVQVQVVTMKHLPTWLEDFAKHVDARQAALVNVTEDVENALREENLKQLGIDAFDVHGQRAHDLLARVLAQRTQMKRMNLGLADD